MPALVAGIHVLRLHKSLLAKQASEAEMSSAIKRRRRKSKAQVLRAQGLRPITIWVPDVRARGFVEEARRQSKLVAESRYEAEDQAFIDSISDIKF